MLSFLGSVAASFRKAGLARVLDGLRDVLDACFFLIGIPPLSARVGDARLAGFLRHRSFLEGLSRGKYESFELDLFRKAISQADVVVDAGAHIGIYATLACRHAKRSARIIAIEPDPYNVRALKYNLKPFPQRRVEVLSKALSDVVGTASMRISRGTISSSLFAGKDTGPYRLRTVATATLDSILGAATMESLVIKMDLEGAECIAVDGMRSTLARTMRVQIFSEIHPSALAGAERRPEDFINRLVDLGLTPFLISETERRLIPVVSTVQGKCNLYCARGNPPWPANDET